MNKDQLNGNQNLGSKGSKENKTGNNKDNKEIS